jgi:hypothetical protein
MANYQLYLLIGWYAITIMGLVTVTQEDGIISLGNMIGVMIMVGIPTTIIYLYMNKRQIKLKKTSV